MTEKGLSYVAYFRTDGGSPKLYTQEYVDELKNKIEILEKENTRLGSSLYRKNRIIEEAYRKLAASVNHFKTENENNAVTFTMRILKREDK